MRVIRRLIQVCPPNKAKKFRYVRARGGNLKITPQITSISEKKLPIPVPYFPVHLKYRFAHPAKSDLFSSYTLDFESKYRK